MNFTVKKKKIKFCAYFGIKQVTLNQKLTHSGCFSVIFSENIFNQLLYLCNSLEQKNFNKT